MISQKKAKIEYVSHESSHLPPDVSTLGTTGVKYSTVRVKRLQQLHTVITS